MSRRGGYRRGRRPPAARRSLSSALDAKLLDALSLRPQTTGELAGILGMSGRDRRRLSDSLFRLERAGKVLRENKRWRPAPGPERLTGRLSVNPRGFAFLSPEEGERDLYIPAWAQAGAFHGDRVAVEVVPGGRGASDRAQVVEVLERSPSPVVGTLVGEGSRLRLVPDNPAYPSPLYVSGPGRPGEKVSALLQGWNPGGDEATARVIEVLGAAGEPAVDVLGTIRGYGLPEKHGPAAEEETARILEMPFPFPGADREDLRELAAFTIDPADARDFDDAVSLETNADGSQVLGVHISDVSHYVRPGGAVDAEALLRGTSVYFPDRVLHMLPPALSTGICSLQEGQDRPCLSAFLSFSAEGVLLSSRFAPSLIRSRRRFSYREVFRIVAERDPDARRADAGLVPVLDGMADLAGRLRLRRLARGALDLELPEEKIVFGPDGMISAIELERGDSAHWLIEEFMLAANEAVADYLARRGAPLIYRVHEPPDAESMREFCAYARSLGLRPGRLARRENLQFFLASVRDTPLGRWCRQPLSARCVPPAIRGKTWGITVWLPPVTLISLLLSVVIRTCIPTGSSGPLWPGKNFLPAKAPPRWGAFVPRPSGEGWRRSGICLN